MAIFFFAVGLEIKREFLVGELRGPPGRPCSRSRRAIGGMLVPALMLRRLQRGRRGRPRLGDPDGDRHRVRARGARRPRARGFPRG